MRGSDALLGLFLTVGLDGVLGLRAGQGTRESKLMFVERGWERVHAWRSNQHSPRHLNHFLSTLSHSLPAFHLLSRLFSFSLSLSAHTDTLTETRYLSQLCLSNLDPSLALAFPESTMVTHLLPLLGELLHVLLVHSLLEHLLHCG